MLDRCLIASRSIEVSLLWTPFDSSICWKFKSRHLSLPLDPLSFVFLYKASTRFFSHFLQSLSTVSDPSPPQTLFSLSRPLTQVFFGLDCSSLHWYDLVFSLFHAFHSYRSRFLGFEKFWVFFEINEVFAKILGWMLLKWVLKHHALHYIAL